MVEDVIQSVNMEDFIKKLPKGYDSIVNNGGANFSEGEKRRLAIVRSLIRNSELMIMDEPTAGLDNKNSFLVWELLTKKMKGVTRVSVPMN